MTVQTRICASAGDKSRSLEIYNAVFPRRAISAERAASFERFSLAFVNLLASVDGEDVGSGFASREASQPDDCFALLTVLPEHRGRGAGTALYNAVSRWGAEHGLGVIETRAEGDDDESLAFAKRRGFVEAWRETGFDLDPRSASPGVTVPADVEIVQLESRPELADGIYDVALEAMPDSPSLEDWQPPGRERYLERNVNSRGTVVVPCARRQRGCRFRDAHVAGRRGAPRDDGGEARLARARGRARVESCADRVGERARADATEGGERRAERADDPNQRVTGISRGAGPRWPTRSSRGLANDGLPANMKPPNISAIPTSSPA